MNPRATTVNPTAAIVGGRYLNYLVKLHAGQDPLFYLQAEFTK